MNRSDNRFETHKALAIKLNEARLLANESPSFDIAGQHGVYGQIATALREVLAHLVGSAGNVEDAYGALLDGCSIDEILG